MQVICERNDGDEAAPEQASRANHTWEPPKRNIQDPNTTTFASVNENGAYILISSQSGADSMQIQP